MNLPIFPWCNLRPMKLKIITLATSLFILTLNLKGLISIYRESIHGDIEYDLFTESSDYACSSWIKKVNRKVLLVNMNGSPNTEDSFIIRALDQIDFDIYLVSVDIFNNIFHSKDLLQFHRIFYTIEKFAWSKHFDHEHILCKVRFFPLSQSINYDKLLLDKRLHEKNFLIVPDSVYTLTRSGLMNDAICSIMEDDSLCDCKMSEVKDCRSSFFLQKSEVYS